MKKTGKGINRERLKIWKRFNRIASVEEAASNIKARKAERKAPYKYQQEFSCALRGMFARWRAKRRWLAQLKGVEFNLSTEELEELYALCREHCPCCGRPWVHLRRHPQAPSIDRINVKLGYSFTNAQVLCRDCNHNKGQDSTRYIP